MTKNANGFLNWQEDVISFMQFTYAVKSEWDLTLESSSKLINYVDDRSGHDKRYAINASKILNKLGWEPSISLDKGLRLTVKWYLENKKWWEPLIKR